MNSLHSEDCGLWRRGKLVSGSSPQWTRTCDDGRTGRAEQEEDERLTEDTVAR